MFERDLAQDPDMNVINDISSIEKPLSTYLTQHNESLTPVANMLDNNLNDETFINKVLPPSNKYDEMPMLLQER